MSLLTTSISSTQPEGSAPDDLGVLQSLREKNITFMFQRRVQYLDFHLARVRRLLLDDGKYFLAGSS